MTYEQVPPLATVPSLFIADWKQAVRVSTGYSVDVQGTRGIVEARRGLLSRPYRTQNVQFVGISPQQFDASLLQAVLEAQTKSRFYAPLYPDYVKLTSDALVDALDVPVTSTACRRFYAGMKVIVVNRAVGPAGMPKPQTRWDYEIIELDGVSDTSLSFLTPLINPWNAGSRVYPAFRSEVDLDASQALISRASGSCELVFKEVAGPLAIPASVVFGDSPPGAEEYNGIPIFDCSMDWSRSIRPGMKRSGNVDVIGLDIAAEIYGDESQYVLKAPLLALDRCSAFRPVQWMDSRGGRTLPLWLPSPSQDLRVTEVTDSTHFKTTEGFPTLTIAQARVGKHVVFVRRDGTHSCHRVTAVSSSSGLLTFTVAPAMDVDSLDSFRRCSWLHLTRFDQDSIEENWITDDKMATEVSFQQVLNDGDDEKMPVVPSVTPLDTGLSGDAWTSPECQQDTVNTVRMYACSCTSCDPERPVHRVADLTLPSRVTVTFAKGQFSKDPAFGYGGLLTNAIACLTDAPWNLTDVVDFGAVTHSRHWHHDRVAGASPLTDWGFGADVVVQRFGYSWTRDYLGNDGFINQIEVRFVAEQTDDITVGAYGALFHVYVFCTELNRSWVDGSLSGGIAFTRADPAVEVNPPTCKRAHPQMLFMAHVPTTMESPCGGPRVSLDPDPDNYDTEYCTRTPSGTPWSTNSITDAMGNCVFGENVEAADMGALSLGGDCEGSRLFPWVTCENGGNGTGLTALRCVHPGWFDPDGGLDLDGGTDVRLSNCSLSDTDPNGCCPGDDSDLNPNRGSVKCLTTVGIPGACGECCVDTTKPANVTVVRPIMHTRQCYDEGCGVTNGSVPTHQIGVMSTTLVLEPYVCSYAVDRNSTDQANRFMEWRYYSADPDYDFEDYHSDFDGVPTAVFSEVLGDWDVSGGVVTIASATGTPPYTRYELADYTNYRNVQVAALFTNFSKKASVLLRTQAGTPTSGFKLEIDPPNNTATISRLAAGVETVLSTQVYEGDLTDPRGYWIIARANGDDLHMHLADYDSVSLDSAMAWDGVGELNLGPHIFALSCLYPRGGVALSGEVGQAFDKFRVWDFSPDVIYSWVRFDKDGWSGQINGKHMNGFGGPNDGTNTDPTCGSGHCSCCNDEYDFFLAPEGANLSFGPASDGYESGSIHPDIPTSCVTGWFVRPFKAIAVSATLCPTDDEDLNTGCCGGANVWSWSCTAEP